MLVSDRRDRGGPLTGSGWVRDRIRWRARALSTMASDPLLTFDRFRVDPSSGQLYGASGPISLTPKALSLLEYLASRPGRLIKKDELLDAIWPGVFVGDAALKVCIREIRRALGDDAQAPRYIETAHRRGYRFIADVTQSQPAAEPPRPASRPSAVAPRSCPGPFNTRAAATSTSPTRCSATDRSTWSSSWDGCRTSSTSGRSRRSRASCAASRRSRG